MVEEQLFIYKIQLTRPEILTSGPTTEEAAVMGRHAEYLQSLTEKEVALLVGRTLSGGADAFGIMIFRAASLDQAREIMLGDPGVQRGIWRAEIYPFHIAFLQKAWQDDE